MIVRNKDEWLSEYRKDKKKVWTWIYLDNNSCYGFNEYSDWFEIQSVVISSNAIPTHVELQYRSISINFDLNDCDGVYYVRSLLGKIGEDAIQTLTLGKVLGDSVHKTIWIKDGLIERYKEETPLDKCFSEAILKWKEKK